MTVLFVATLGGLAWAGHDVITIDGGALGLDDLPGTGGGGGTGAAVSTSRGSVTSAVCCPTGSAT